MDIEKLNEIVQKYRKEYWTYVGIKRDKLKFISYQVLKEKELPMSTVEYSKKFSINESIKIISQFLSTIDVKLKEQFDNIINAVDENNKPLVNFIIADSKYYEKYEEEYTKEIEEELKQDSRFCGLDEKTYIHINNTLEDIFIIIHELFHHMNITPLYYSDSPNILNSTILTNIKITIDKFLKNNKEINLDDYEMYNSFVQVDYGEVVSIVMEKLLGQYLVQEGLITENDYNIKLNKRLYSSKIIAKRLIVIIELFDEASQYWVEKVDESIVKKVFDKLNSNIEVIDILKYIINREKIDVLQDQRYVIAQVLLKKYDYTKESIDEVIKINDYLSNPNSDVEVINKIL